MVRLAVVAGLSLFRLPMADIFISYAKADWQLVLKLSAFLETKGWSVWWDKGLKPGDRYRTEIAAELGRARAVLVVWTAASVGSDWVRAEAGAARNAGKLVPLKTSEVGYADIPMPFGELHTENVANEEMVALAVTTALQTAAPAPRGGIGSGLSHLKYQALTWLGILGGALTLFTNLGSFVKLASWSAWLVDHWKDVTQLFWTWSLAWIGIQVPKEWAPTATFFAFYLSIVAGVIVLDWKRNGSRPQAAAALRMSAFYVGGLLSTFCVFWMAGEVASGLGYPAISNALGSIFLIAFLFLPLGIALYDRRYRFTRLASSFIFYAQVIALAFLPSVDALIAYGNRKDVTATETNLRVTALVVAVNVLLLVSVFAAKPPSLLKRLSFVCLGLALLIGLNAVSGLPLLASWR